MNRALKCVVGTALTVSLVIGLVPIQSIPIARAKTNVESVGHPVFKNTEQLDKVYDLQGNDYTADSQLMSIYEKDLKAGGDSFYIDRVLKRTGVANGNAENNGNDDGNTFMTRGRALYMYTSDPSVIGFGGNTAYHQPMSRGDMYQVTFTKDGKELSAKEDSKNRENMPSHWISSYELGDSQVKAKVKKFIHYQNVAVTLVSLKNEGDNDITLDAAAKSSFVSKEADEKIGDVSVQELTGKLSSPAKLTTLYPKLAATQGKESFDSKDGKLTKTITIKAKETKEIKVMMAFTTKEIPESDQYFEKYLKMDQNDSILLEQKKEYNKWWAETMPYIDVPNKAIQKAIDYRWWLENFNKLDANIPGYDYQYPVTIEGVLGYNNAIALTQPMHLQDTKWMRNESLAYGQLLSIGNSSQSSAFLDNPGNRSNWNNHYGQYIGTAGLEAFKVIGGNKQLAKTFAYYFEHDAKGQIDHYGNHTSATTPENKLIDYASAYMTGNDADTISFAYPGAGTWKTHAENAYVYGAAKAASKLYEMAGDSAKSSELNVLSDDIRSDILKYLWCEKDHAFETRAVNPSSNFVSHNADQPNLIPYKENNNFNYYSEKVVPTDEKSLAKYSKMFSYLADENEFPIFPYYTANQNDNKKQSGSNNFSNINFTVQARAYEAALRTYDKDHQYVTPEMLSTMVEWCAWNMYPDGGDVSYPNNNEFYNMDNKTKDNYYRSWIYHNILGNYNYIFVEDVAGVVPREDNALELDPIEFNYDHFMINNVRYHGKDVTVVWDDPTDDTDYYGDLADGYSVYMGGKLIFTLNKKAHVLYQDGKLTYPDGKADGITEKVEGEAALQNAIEVGISDRVKTMMEKSGIEADSSLENVAKGKKVTASYTPDKAREASWANKHRSDNGGTDKTSKAVNEEKPDPTAITDGVTVNMPFWGNYDSKNQSDSVIIDLGKETTIDRMNLYFYNDRQDNGYSEPAKYTVEYFDGTSYQQVQNQNRTPQIVQANYNENQFNAVKTDKIKVTVFNKENHFTAITEVQLYHEGTKREIVKNEAPAVSLEKQDANKDGNLSTLVTATCEDDGMPWEKELNFEWKVVDQPEDSKVVLGSKNSLTTKVTASQEGDYTLSFTANDGELETTKEITVSLKKKTNAGTVDEALDATPSSDYTASWENLNGINDADFEPTSSNVGAGKGWGNWRDAAEGATNWVAYTWKEPVTITKCDLYWYDDGGGTRVPKSISFQYKDEDGNWKDASMLTDYADANKIDTYNSIYLKKIKTTQLRLNMVTQASATGIYRFKVFGEGVASLQPVHVTTKPGVVPTLPAKVTGVTESGQLCEVPVKWNEMKKEDLAKDGVVEVSGVDAQDHMVTAYVYVKSDMDVAQITSIEESTINYQLSDELVLPSQVTVGYNNGAYEDVAVEWGQVDRSDLLSAGTHRFNGLGSVKNTEMKADLSIKIEATKENLKEVISYAKQIDVSKYSDASVQVLEKAIKDAENVFSDQEEEAQIKEAMNSLSKAIKGLSVKEETPTQSPTPTASPSPVPDKTKEPGVTPTATPLITPTPSPDNKTVVSPTPIPSVTPSPSKPENTKKKTVCKVTYVLNKGINNKKNKKSYTTTKKVKLYAPSRKGYSFVGWYQGKKKYTVIPKGYNKSLKLTAKWKKIKVQKVTNIKVTKIKHGYRITWKVTQKGLRFEVRVNGKRYDTSKKQINIKKKSRIKIRAYQKDSASKKVFSKYTLYR
ncbi:hypothetical protein lbkm_1752 [Lachnospiraceae bacterium KM106-2]|nr:hypothetical protein lbkm_1752 [Lachnospiraceae bacterium KM106-2]